MITDPFNFHENLIRVLEEKSWQQRAIKGTMHVTLLLKPAKGEDSIPSMKDFFNPSSKIKTYTPEEFAQEFAPPREAYRKIVDFAQKFNLIIKSRGSNVKPEDIDEEKLEVVHCTYSNRLVVLKGKVKDLEEAFSTNVIYRGLPAFLRNLLSKMNYISQSKGSYSIPDELTEYVEDVIGLHNFPLFRSGKFPPGPDEEEEYADAMTDDDFSQVRSEFRSKYGSIGYTGAKYAELYNFPKEVDGTGQTIGIIQFGGGYDKEEMVKYFEMTGMETPMISDMSIFRGRNGLTQNYLYDAEVAMDIQVAASAAPGAEIVNIFVPERYNIQGLIHAIEKAIKYDCNIISLSWAWPEGISTFSEKNMASVNRILQCAAAQGVTVVCASGDHGSHAGVKDGRPHIYFPSSSPYVLSCGGTSVTVEEDKIVEEVVWNDTFIFGDSASQLASTGGFSKGYGDSHPNTMPLYQYKVMPEPHCNSRELKRGNPDVSASANLSKTGYWILAKGFQFVSGGTSAAAPLWAALIARINQKMGKPQGFINPSLYALASVKGVFNQIIKGNNSISHRLSHWDAGEVWNPCTGLGSPHGENLLRGLEMLNSRQFAKFRGFFTFEEIQQNKQNKPKLREVTEGELEGFAGIYLERLQSVPGFREKFFKNSVQALEEEGLDPDTVYPLIKKIFEALPKLPIPLSALDAFNQEFTIAAARISFKAWLDPMYLNKVVKDPHKALEEFGVIISKETPIDINRLLSPYL